MIAKTCHWLTFLIITIYVTIHWPGISVLFAFTIGFGTIWLIANQTIRDQAEQYKQQQQTIEAQ